MADRALTEEALLRGLYDIRLPADTPGGLTAELLAAIGVALIAAVLIGLLLRGITLPSTKTTEPGLQDRLSALAGLPPEDRQIALLHLLKSQRPEAYKQITARLYAPGGTPDLATLEAEVVGHD